MGGGRGEGRGEVKLPCTNISFRWGKVILLDSSLIVGKLRHISAIWACTLAGTTYMYTAPTIIEKQIPNLNDSHTFNNRSMYFLPYNWIRGLFLTVIFFCIFFVLIKICQLWEGMGDEELHKDKQTNTRHKPSPCDSPFVLPLTRFCLSEMKVFTSGNALTTSSLNCCTNGASVVLARSFAVFSLEAKHCTAFCALFKITITSDNVVCFTR